MCGLTGFWDFRTQDRYPLAPTIDRMTWTLFERGPDSAGTWVDENLNLALGHRRLAILDLSPAGHQPMVSASGQSVIAYNGEIFNGPDLKRDLERAGVTIQGHCDTRILVEGCDLWGVEAMVKKCIGMFAFAYFHRPTQTLTLVRDRLGIKPLYFGFANDTFLFGSQTKSFYPHPDWVGEINPRSLNHFFRRGHLTNDSIYKGFSQVLPGHWVRIDAQGTLTQGAYWHRTQGTDTTPTLEGIKALALDAVGRRMMADVPLGAFLSGGVDSSTVVALMQAQSSRPIKTFTIGFTEPAFDEAPHARAVARHLKTDHTELYVTPREAMDVIPQLPTFFDEPFADSSQIPTYLVSQLAREHVTVALSGDGGDELFGGYNRHIFAHHHWPRLRSWPKPLRQMGGSLLKTIPFWAWDRCTFLPLFGDKMQKVADALCASTGADLYGRLTTHWDHPPLRGQTFSYPALLSPESPDLMASMQGWDVESYLPGDILTKVDRASMAVSLEARVPLLDHRLVEMAHHLPGDMKIRGGKSKWALRQILYDYVPADLIERPKQGFGIPVGQWLRGPLRDWAESLLDRQKMLSQGYLDPDPIHRAWAEHLKGQRDHTGRLWCVLMFQAWMDFRR